LREVTRAQNNRNKKKNKNNTFGVTGIYLTPKGKFRAIIRAGGGNINLGTFFNKFDAILARLLAEKKYGYTARHGL